METTERTALIAGATGLVGSECLQQLLSSEHYREVISIGRRPLEITNAKLHDEVVDFDQLPENFETRQMDDVYCCLGTTIKKAGSKENFRKVDYTYVMNVAKLAVKCGAQRLMVISAIGADPDSRVFYSRIKGEVELDVQKLSLPEIHLFRPSLLLGDRKEFRLGEKIGAGLMLLAQPFFRGNLSKYHPIDASKVALAMYRAAFQNKKGVNIYEYPLMSDLVNRTTG